MKLNNILLYISIFFSAICISQNMQQGFTYLETGKYQQAEIYFNNVLKEHPENKTARLCYGRAVGLHGNAERSILIFNNLLIDFPSDFEIKLNYAEALLWNKEYLKAEKYYKKLLLENDLSFSALLGYANTLSNLKNYSNALFYVDKALMVSPGNTNALNSKKYIRLGLAYDKSIAKHFQESEKILKENLIDFPKDTETLLNLANLYLISNQINKATSTYASIGDLKKNEVISLNGLSLTSHFKGKNKKALEISKKALSKITPTTTKSILKQTDERYVQALIWNKKYALANQKIKKLIKTNGNENWILALRANLNIYKSNFKQSIVDYTSILNKDSTSFDGNLGKANALKASGKHKKAYKSAENTLTYHKKQKDALSFIKKLDKKFTPFIETKLSYSKDNGNNKAQSYKANISFPVSLKTKLLTSYNYRKTSNNSTKNQGNSKDLLIGISHQTLPNLILNGNIGFTKSIGETNNYNQLIADISVNLKPFRLQNLKLGFKREIQNFNADLLDQEISQNHFYLNYSLNINLGWYSQYYYTTQNDGNTRNLLFTSLYYKIMEKPSAKAGINFQTISFKNQVPTIYFSPEKFKAIEVFFNIIKDENISKPNEWFYELTGALGMQFIENNEKQNTYRIQGKLGYKFSERALANIYGTQSNIASTTAAGFTFTVIGFRFKWYLTKKPVFKTVNIKQ